MQSRKKKDLSGIDSGDQYNQQINDKLNDLWTQMKHKKTQIIKTLTPAYSRKSQNPGPGYNSFSVQHDSKQRSREVDRLVSAQTEIMKLREKLAAEAANSKQKEVEIEALRKHVGELMNDKKQLLMELRSVSMMEGGGRAESMVVEQENNKNQLNESSIRNDPKPNPKHQIFVDQQGITGDTQRLLQLLRSTEQYRQFVFYYDNNQLSYLRTLGKLKRKHCQCDPSEKQKTLWAPRNVLQMLAELNIKNNFNLKRTDMEKIVYNINLLYLQNQKAKISQVRAEYERRVRELQREVNHAIPYEIMQIQKQKERELTAKRGGRRVNSMAATK